MVIAFVLTLASSVVAEAACTSARCRDTKAIATARAVIGERCNCALSPSHKSYMRCVKEVLKQTVRDGGLPASCKKAVLKCEGPTTCGQKEAVACCTMKRGKMRARIVSSVAKCKKGRACPGVRSALDACTPQGECSGVAATFRSVQKVFAQSCALESCHSSFAREGGLVLDSEEVSYSNLVGKESVHEQAKSAGLLRVKPGDPENSFLIRKLRGLGPGDSMPQGTQQLLPESTISPIEDWVRRGARTTAEECPGNGVGGTCDTTPIDPGNFVWQPEAALPVPAPNEGIQLFVPRRDVEPGTEWETCYAFRPNWSEIGGNFGLPGVAPTIREQEYRMHQGSHHLLLYMYFGAHPEAYPLDRFFPCFAADCLNPGDCPPDSGRRIPIGGTQVAGTRYVVQYPEGVGLPVFGLNTVLIANLHYTNPFQPAQPIYGEAWLNLYFHQRGGVKAILDGVFAVNYADMFVEPYETTRLTQIWKPFGILSDAPVDAAVFQLFGHMHKRGELFQIDFVKDGTCSASQALCGRDEDCACRPYQRPSQPDATTRAVLRCVNNTDMRCDEDADCPGSFCGCVPNQTCNRGAEAEDVTLYHTSEWDHAPVTDFPKPYLLVDQDQGLRWTCQHTNGYRDEFGQEDPTRPSKKCHEGCNSCGWTGGRCSTNGTLCNPASVCNADEICVADETQLSPTGFRCRDDRWRDFCCPDACIPSNDARTCWFTRGKELNYHPGPQTYQEGEPIPVVFGELADDDMCNMFGYFIRQADVAVLP
jgi:hypothetical protein